MIQLRKYLEIYIYIKKVLKFNKDRTWVMMKKDTELYQGRNNEQSKDLVNLIL